MKRSFAQRLIAAPYLLWGILFSVVPLGVVAFYALTDANGSFTTDNLMSVTAYSGVFIRSILYSLIATLICLLLAYPMALCLCRAKASSQKILVMLVMLPMWTSLLLRTYSLMNLMADTGIINSILTALGLPAVKMINTPGAVIFGMVYNYLPYMIIPIYTVMLKIEKSAIEAAQDLGCNAWQVLTRVILPLSMPGIASGLTMVFVPSVSTFYISQKLGGGMYEMIGDTIERKFVGSGYDYNVGAAISLVLMVLILICMGIMNQFTDDDSTGGVLM